MNGPVEFHPDEMISAYLDGAADPEERARVEEHLRTCPRCREMVDDFRSLSATAGMEEPPPVPPGLAARIRRQVEEARRQAVAYRRPAWRSPFALAAATLAVATLVWVAVRQQAPAPTSLPVTGPATQKDATGIAPPPSTAGKKDDRTALGKRAPGGTSAGAVDPRASGNGEAGADKTRLADGREPAGAGVEDKGRTLSQRGESAPGVKQEGGLAPEAAPSAPAADETPQGLNERDASGAVFSQAGRSDAPAPAARPREKLSAPRSAGAQAVLGAAEESVVAGTPPGPRSLVYETPDVTLTLSEEGQVTLVLRGYACTVNVAPPAMEEGKYSPAPELASLFARASSRDIVASVPRTANPDTLSPEETAAHPKVITLRGPDGGILYTMAYGDAPETAPPRPVLDLEAEMRRSVGSSFRKALEDRCGPIPGDPALLAP